MGLTTIDGDAVETGTIYCIGRNVFAHALELGNEPPSEPLVFLKSAASLRGLHGPVGFPDETFHHEVEVVLVLDEPVDHGADPGWSCVGGLALGLDLTRRGVQKQLKSKGLPWTIAKSFLGSAVVGPVVPLDRFPQPDAVRFTLHVDDQLRQQGDLSELSFDVPDLLRRLAALHPLQRGDLVFTGTPAGVGPIRKGDRFTLAFESPALRFEGVL